MTLSLLGCGSGAAAARTTLPSLGCRSGAAAARTTVLGAAFTDFFSSLAASRGSRDFPAMVSIG
ncbi:hypothetical protein PF010_g5139 [Phytophthora fragariae]|uniref:Uncharacterized protein n=1 Tax=Phytophthora fragariae TaxID=53985 RepID=A0A6A3KE87_9STRA|nr:hypothetical protein PF009_g25719 [Phytophthora fragariae]KAE9003898.1 hypothetical protein PF011_g12696 [Phytophthora fragariae]KAE9094354.1 hypothetical protein PF006_g24239 [Phytophthora fragariae]KAE9126784.1 hypothetical protein PF010_g5139 [Phytophthora fragariae]KAE9300979.1 hypothetical protein PF001_g14661 [Phytophthora fragariae]